MKKEYYEITIAFLMLFIIILSLYIVIIKKDNNTLVEIIKTQKAQIMLQDNIIEEGTRVFELHNNLFDLGYYKYFKSEDGILYGIDSITKYIKDDTIYGHTGHILYR